MKQITTESLNHAIYLLEAIEHDLARISHIDDATAGLVSDCMEHRLAMLNALRHIRQRFAPPAPTSKPLSTTEIMLNAATPPEDDGEIAPEPPDRTPVALAEFRRRQRRANRLAIAIAILVAITIGVCVKFAFDHLR